LARKGFGVKEVMVRLKLVIKELDRIILRGAVQKLYSYILERTRTTSELITENRNLKILSKSSKYQTKIFHLGRANLELASLCDLYGSDKGELRLSEHPYPGPSHSYVEYYSQIFSHCRNRVTKVFECGIGTNNPFLASSMGKEGQPGASLRVWRDYFPNSVVIGADIDTDILFEENRIKTFYVDQKNPSSIEALWRVIGISDFDIMIDDGLHTFEAGTTLWLNSIERLAPDGVYIIEDVGTSDLVRYRNFFRNYNFIVDFVCLIRPDKNLADNNLVVIRKNSPETNLGVFHRTDL
jgi:hypothetical protein